MTIEEAIAIIHKEYLCVDRDCDIERSCGKCDLMMPTKEPILEAYNMAIKALEQEPSRDMEEIEEVINCDADAETKCKMISNILTAKPHYFEEPQESEE